MIAILSVLISGLILMLITLYPDQVRLVVRKTHLKILKHKVSNLTQSLKKQNSEARWAINQASAGKKIGKTMHDIIMYQGKIKELSTFKKSDGNLIVFRDY